MNALPSPKPTRLNRLAMRFAALVAAVFALGAASWFTRPPELVRWISPSLFNTKRKASVLIPSGWEQDLRKMKTFDLNGQRLASYWFVPVDHRPAWLRRFFPRSEPGAFLLISGGKATGLVLAEGEDTATESDNMDGKWVGKKTAVLHGEDVIAYVQYWRVDKRAYDTTYRQICKSLRIE